MADAPGRGAAMRGQTEMGVNQMTRRGILGGALAALGLGAAPPAAAAESLTLRMRNKKGVPALGAMIVTPSGFDMLEVAGVRRAGATDAVTKSDKWHLGSNGKAMTAALYARLVESGKAKWGATLGELFAGTKIDPAWGTVTIDELLTHTAGVSEGTLIGPVWLVNAQGDKRPVTEQRKEAAETVLGQKPGGKRGAFAYANANYILAGAAMERLTGASWEMLMAEQLFAPLGIASAGFGAPVGQNPWGHQSTMFGFGGLAAVDPSGIADNPKALGPAGTIHMNLEDYAKFLRIFFQGYAGGVLSVESVTRLTKPVEAGDRSYAMGWITFAARPWAKGPALAHEGSNTMWHAFTALGPARQRAVVTVCNAHSGGGDAAAQELGLDLIKGLG
jgi:CubicO group peptidase (beta-lactamase class C family)